MRGIVCNMLENFMRTDITDIMRFVNCYVLNDVYEDDAVLS